MNSRSLPYIGDVESPETAGLERFEGLAERLRTAALRATIQPWDVSDSYFNVSSCVVGRPATVGLTVLIARAKAPRAEHAITLYRSAGPLFVASIEALIRTARAAQDRPIFADTVERITSGPWGDRCSQWFWNGWDPATRRGRVKADNAVWSDRWTSPIKTGSVVRGSREIDIPRNSLVSIAPGRWRCAKDNPHAMTARMLVDGDGVEVARFAREEDATFIALAREAVEVFGAAYAAVTDLIEAKAGGYIEPGALLSTIANTTPWPTKVPLEAPPQ